MQSPTGLTLNVTTDKVEGDSFYGYTDGIQTIAISYNASKAEYRPRSISINCNGSDWFDIQPRWIECQQVVTNNSQAVQQDLLV